MNTIKLQNFISTIKKGQDALGRLSATEKNALEKVWDVEHAYYSSALEGSKIDRKQFDVFAESVK